MEKRAVESICFEKLGGALMKESVYKSYDELPLMLNAETLAKVLGVAPS